MADRSRPPRALLVGSLPPPWNGQSVAFQTLVEGLDPAVLPFEVLDITGGEAGRDGRPTLARALEWVRILARYAARVARPTSVVYLTIAQSRQGFVRDACMVWLARALHRRVVAHLHGGSYDAFYAQQPAGLRALVRVTLRRVDRLVVLGETLAGMFAFEPALASRIEVVANGLPTAAPALPAPRALPAPGTGRIRLLYMSSLFESKGYLDVLAAVDRLVHARGLDVECHFCGEFRSYVPDDERVRSAAHARELFESGVRERDLEDRVRYRGVVTGAEKQRELQAAHFFLLPTRYGKEGQPISIIEAMAHGCVVVSTDYRAIPELVRPGETGELVPPRDPDAIAKAVAALCGDPARYRETSRRARERFEARFTREAHVARMLRVLRGEPLPDA